MPCKDYTTPNDCGNSVVDTCSWCGSIYDNSGCCLDGSYEPDQSCSCFGQDTHGTWSGFHIALVVCGAIFWIVLCVALWRCCTRRGYYSYYGSGGGRSNTVVVTRTILVDSNNTGNNNGASTTYGSAVRPTQYGNNNSTSSATTGGYYYQAMPVNDQNENNNNAHQIHEGQVFNPNAAALGYRTAAETY